MKRLLDVKLRVFEKEYQKHLELFKKETGIVLDTEDVHTFAKFDRFLNRRMKDAIKATTCVDKIFMILGEICFNDSLNFDNGISLDLKNKNIYFPSDGSDAAGELFCVDPFKPSTALRHYLETDPSACKMVYDALEKVEEMREEHEYNEFVRKHS